MLTLPPISNLPPKCAGIEILLAFSMKNERPVLLVIHPGSLGDALLALSGVRALRRFYPKHRLVWMGQAEIGRLLENCQEVDESLSLEGQFFAQLYLPHEQWADRLKKLIEHCTHCVGWLNDPDGVLKENLTSFGINNVIIQSPKSPKLIGLHTEDRFVEILKPMGDSATFEKRKLKIPYDLKNAKGRRDLEGFVGSPHFPFVVMHPGSGSMQKCADSSLLREIARRLKHSLKITLVILKGPADERAVNNLISEMSPEDYCLVKDESLLSVAYILSQATLYIGHDSGITHLASSLGIPCLALFGPTDPAQWAPRGDHVSVIGGLSCHCVDWKEVQACHPKLCLNLSADVMLQQVERLLEFQSRDMIVRQQDRDVVQEV